MITVILIEVLAQLTTSLETVQQKFDGKNWELKIMYLKGGPALVIVVCIWTIFTSFSNL